jgi:hypothetical protein
MVRQRSLKNNADTIHMMLKRVRELVGDRAVEARGMKSNGSGSIHLSHIRQSDRRVFSTPAALCCCRCSAVHPSPHRDAQEQPGPDVVVACIASTLEGALGMPSQSSSLLSSLSLSLLSFYPLLHCLSPPR